MLRFLPPLLRISPGDTVFNVLGSVWTVSLSPLVLFASSRDKAKGSATAETAAQLRITVPVLMTVGGTQGGARRGPATAPSWVPGPVVRSPPLQPAGPQQHL